ncbi:MAG: cell division ATP-binding protein FtsE [Nitrospirae bacterium]|nr:cell division ATP-binding protein FtsE [Nitrospirota bacterium]
MVEMFHVSKYYDREVPALEDVSLKVDKGEFIFITGPSGAGKTTLLKLLFCGEKADAGQILIAGWDLDRLKKNSIPYLRRNIGIVFQDFKLLPNMTVLENIVFAMRVVGNSEKEIKKKALNVLKLVDLMHKADDYPLHLSGGEQQRVAIGRAVCNEPTILLADEPTGNLDTKSAVAIIDIFKDINSKGTTVLVATHNENLFLSSGRRVVILDRGRVTGEGLR